MRREREKNLALRKHLDQLSKEEKKPIPRNQSARPKSASKYGRKNDPGNQSKHEDEINQNERVGTQDEFGSNASDEKEILINKINFEEVEHIAIELRNILKVKKISYNKIIEILPKKSTTLSNLKDLLSNKFNFEDSDALMTARYIFDEDQKLKSETVAERIQSFIRLNNTVEPYRLEDESEDENEEEIAVEIPKQSVETEKGKLFKQSEKIETEVHEEIHENYSDAHDQFDVEEENVEGDRKINKQDSPIIQDETDRDKKKEESERHEESEIGEDEGLDIAEKWFSKIADSMKSKNTTVIQHFRDYISSQVAEAEDGKEYEIVYIPPMGFLEGIQLLGVNLSDIEIKWLMVILMKPELDNIILVQDLWMVMENFGIEEDIDGITDGEGDTERNKMSQRAQTLPQKEGI